MIIALNLSYRTSVIISAFTPRHPRKSGDPSRAFERKFCLIKFKNGASVFRNSLKNHLQDSSQSMSVGRV
ncbi:MAG: hypothetical protein US49_C0009G0022 [candidate division TM6 bacterium GW2011_GWF2_37_49]|nr:MAG: hypothetical protein US49_C0009G0022 [candidate division TM6 bacterium GW2011_GWF2_37_49]